MWTSLPQTLLCVTWMSTSDSSQALGSNSPQVMFPWAAPTSWPTQPCHLLLSAEAIAAGDTDAQMPGSMVKQYGFSLAVPLQGEEIDGAVDTENEKGAEERGRTASFYP